MTGTVKGSLKKPKNLSIKWVIDRFFADCKQKGDYYESPKSVLQYDDQSTKWCLRVYPKNFEEEKKEYVSLYLYFESENESEVKVDYELSMIRQRTSELIQKHEGTRQFNNTLNNWGWPKFVLRSVVNDGDDNLISDTFIIMCKITFYPKDFTKNFVGYGELLNKIETRSNDHEQVLESGNFSDVTFVMQNKKIEAHKVVLSCANPVFKAMFEHRMKETEQNVVEVADIDYDVMMELFRFLYSGKVKNIEMVAGDLLIAADKYQVKGLKALCEKTLYDKLTIDNAIEYLKLTDRCDTIHLKNLIIEFVAAQYKKVIEKPGFADLPSNLMFLIIQAIAKKD